MSAAKAAAAPPAVTLALAARASALRFEDLSADAVDLAGHCLLDWFAVTLAGAEDDGVVMLRETCLADGASPVATLVCDGRATSPAQAALINGTASHALDYDDVNLAIIGHPTVVLAPAILALAEKIGASGRDVITAFVAGYDVCCRVGALTSPSHYGHGFHATGTVGTLGAAAACARLLGLDADRTAMALGIAATTAAGLKSMFGTMCKPLHAGRAAECGLQAAVLAAQGFVARPDAIECRQGFAATQSTDFHVEAALAALDPDHHLRNNLFKYHASCYLTHAPIEAGRKVAAAAGVSPQAIERIEIAVAPVTDGVCNIPSPRTGLEAKFSLRLTTAMALAGRDTSAIATFDDAGTADPTLVELCRRTTVRFVDGWNDTRSAVTIELADGRRFSAEHDAGIPSSDLAAQGARLGAKFRSLVVPLLGAAQADALARAVVALPDAGSVRDTMILARRP